MPNNLTLTTPSYTTTDQKFGTGALNGGFGTFPFSVINSTACTIDAWVKRSGTGNTCLIWAQGTGGYPVWCGVNTNGTPNLSYSASQSIAGSTSICDGLLHHIRAILTTSGCSLSVDGVQVASTSNSVGWNTSAIAIGNTADNNFGWGGVIDEFAIWNSNKGATYTVPSAAYAGTESGLSALYHFDGNGNDSRVASGGTITLSPSSVTANTIGQVISITGSSTSFSGTPFSTAGGYGVYLTAQSVADGTHGSITLNPGTPGYGNITVTDTGGGGAATLTINPPALGALKIGFVGDSITAGTNGDPVTQMASFLGAQGYTVTKSNQGNPGTSTADWISSGSLLGPAMSAFATAGVTIVQVLLGTNDCRSPNNLTVAQHVSNMRNIVRTLRSNGYKVILTHPIYTMPNAIVSTARWINDPNAFYTACWQLDLALVDGVNVFRGDETAFAVFAENAPTALADGVHANGATWNNTLGDLWGRAFMNKLAGIGARWSYS